MRKLKSGEKSKKRVVEYFGYTYLDGTSVSVFCTKVSGESKISGEENLVQNSLTYSGIFSGEL